MWKYSFGLNKCSALMLELYIWMLCWSSFAHIHVQQFVTSSIRLSTPNWEGTMQQWWKLKRTCKGNWSEWRWVLCT